MTCTGWSSESESFGSLEHPMETLDTDPPPKGFSIALTYTDADINRYQGMANAHWQKQDESREKDYVYWGFVSKGTVLAIVGAVAVALTGQIEPIQAPLVGILIYGCFVAGEWNQHWKQKKLYNKAQNAMRKTHLTQSRDGVLHVRARSVTYRLPGRRSFYARSAFTSATVEAGFVLLWRNGEIEIAVPAHLLSDEQCQMLVAFGTPPAS